ncbi:MAG TPA: hypothetical protein DEQ30_01985 [Porphyromonadaceae bacterium]|nr:hypothetical protein [Porphyromonadaceae bacterium]
MTLFPLAHLEVKFIVDGVTYTVSDFKIGFAQPTDYKGQPQHEIKGGQFVITLSQAADNTLYLWAKTPTALKSGTVLFQTDLGMTVLLIEFAQAYCVSLSRSVDETTGTKTILVVSPEEVSIDGVEHNNFWP